MSSNLPDGEAELSVDGIGVCRVEEHGDCSSGVLACDRIRNIFYFIHKYFQGGGSRFTYFLFAVGEALQFPGGLDPLHLDLEGVGGEALSVLVNLHLPTKVLNRPCEAEVGVVPEVIIIVDRKRQ